MSPHPSSMPPEALPPGFVLTGGWRILERLGVGGYGVVYRVEPVDSPGRYFALKLTRHTTEGRALRELTLLLDRAVHPNVVAVHACGRWPDIVTGHFYFVMDWVSGPPLHVWADQHNPSFRRLAETFRRVALALDTLHAGDVLHRDLKPEHILLRDTEGDPVLIDLGASAYTGAPTLTTGPLPPGTRHLRSPEAIRFHQRHWRHPDARYQSVATDDLYALGVCLYRAATGHYPFPPDWPADVLCAAITSQPPVAPSELNPRVPPEFDAIILRLLEKLPEQRFQSGAELASTLAPGRFTSEHWDAPLFGTDTPAPPRKPPARAPNPGTRLSRPLLLAVSTVLLLLAGGGFFQTWRQTTPRVTHQIDPLEGHKIARHANSHHSEAVTDSPRANPIPVTVAPVAPPLQDPTPVMKPPAPPAKPRAPSLARLSKVALACTGLACSSSTPYVQHRPIPPETPCPAGAKETAERFGFEQEDQFKGSIGENFGTPYRNITIREGHLMTNVHHTIGKVPRGSQLVTEIIFTNERVYGRIRELRVKDEVYPVCMVFHTFSDVGLKKLPGGDEDHAVIFNLIDVRVVDRFREIRGHDW
ncbi:serine/threonine protein kinase [Myxococcus sp. K38C18041901]|uniref:serine/threonine protein kinase n=1 Tax=Myxococcus guangdongensis TaxID=2906760 RepID=UPI0020A7589B|nr:serine/threonine-protein kinase [Myxococcus guangdongensis]MCP3062887.1 serine/threonine protein kinase [Myxococcus guangdongensis]